MAESDPITKIHGGIWSMLEASSEFKAVVRTGNRIKYVGGTRDPEKGSMLVKDLPQVAVYRLGIKPRPENTSNSSRLITLWSVEVSTGTRKDETVAQLDWIVYCALLTWRTYLKSLTWGGETFVTEFRSVSVDEEIVARRKLRVPEGWASLWVGQCDAFFSTSLLLGDEE